MSADMDPRLKLRYVCHVSTLYGLDELQYYGWIARPDGNIGRYSDRNVVHPHARIIDSNLT